MRTSLRRLATALLVGGLAGGAFAQDVSEETVELFKTTCASCHTIGGGRLAGPDLKGATERQDAKWLAAFIVDPQKAISSGDPYAQQLLKEARGVVMPPVAGMTLARAMKLVELIEVESGKETSRFEGIKISDRPLTEADVDRGRRLFEGRDAFVEGGPACISCHQVEGTWGFGGGRLGPDLTDAFSRLEGRKALAAWLAAPPAATMQPVYKDAALDGDEILALVAYMKSTAEAGRPGPERGPLSFLIAGIAGVVGVLIAFDIIWRRRFRAVRRPLVKGLAR